MKYLSGLDLGTSAIKIYQLTSKGKDYLHYRLTDQPNAGGYFLMLKIVKLQSEQVPVKGAVLLAAYGSRWFDSLKECADVFLRKINYTT